MRPGVPTTTTPHGNVEPPFDVANLVAAAGASYGTSLVWTLACASFFTFIMFAAVSKMVMVSGHTMLWNYRQHFGSAITTFIVLALTCSQIASIIGVMEGGRSASVEPMPPLTLALRRELRSAAGGNQCITITRAKLSLDFPASFMLIASMNPCPCGYYTHPQKKCSCTSLLRKKYLFTSLRK